MRIKLSRPNINSKEYHEGFYIKDNMSGVSLWDMGKDDAIKRLKGLAHLVEDTKNHLDIGCADGTLTKLLLEKFPESKGCGVDISQVACEVAKENCPNGMFTQSDCYKLPYKDETFDLVHCGQLIEHLDHPDKLFKEVHRVLQKSGTFILTTINEKAEDYREHLWKWDLKGVEELLEGFKIVSNNDRYFNGSLLLIVAKKC